MRADVAVVPFLTLNISSPGRWTLLLIEIGMELRNGRKIHELLTKSDRMFSGATTIQRALANGMSLSRSYDDVHLGIAMTANNLLRLISSAMMIALVFASRGEAQDKLRVVILTDISNEPDDQESLVRFLTYSNEFDVEGLIATTGCWKKNDPDIVARDTVESCVWFEG